MKKTCVSRKFKIVSNRIWEQLYLCWKSFGANDKACNKSAPNQLFTNYYSGNNVNTLGTILQNNNNSHFITMPYVRDTDLNSLSILFLTFIYRASHFAYEIVSFCCWYILRILNINFLFGALWGYAVTRLNLLLSSNKWILLHNFAPFDMGKCRLFTTASQLSNAYFCHWWMNKLQSEYISLACCCWYWCCCCVVYFFPYVGWCCIEGKVKTTIMTFRHVSLFPLYTNDNDPFTLPIDCSLSQSAESTYIS